MKLILLLALSLVADTGTSPADYAARALHERNPQARLELLGKALAIDPNYVPALRHRAALYAVLDKKQEALADIARAADLSPDDPQVNALAGGYAEEAKDHGRAAGFYRRAVDADTDNAELHYRLAWALIRARRSDDALREADFLVERYPDQSFPYEVRADACEWLGRYADAVRDISLLIERTPNAARMYIHRSSVERTMGDAHAALVDAQKAIDLGEQTPSALSARGLAYEALGQWELALADFSAASEHRDEERRYYVIWSCIVLRKQGKPADAERFAKESLKGLKPDEWITPVIRFLAGEIKEDEVFRAARKAEGETLREQLCEAHYYLGAHRLTVGDRAGAEKLFRDCIALRVCNFYEHGFAVQELRKLETGKKLTTDGH